MSAFMRIKLAAVGMLVAGTALAADRTAPAYFLDTVMAASTAQQLALACPSVSVNLDVVSKASGDVLEKLKADGFDTTSETLGMQDTNAEFAKRQAAFLAQHDLAEGADADAVCSAARVEMAQNTQIGAYLMEVAQ